MQSQQADRQDTAAITAEKGRTRTLARWIRTALTTLEAIDPDDMEDGGDSMRSLIIDGQVLVNMLLQDGGQLVERRKVQTADHPMRRATDWPQIDGEAVADQTYNSPEIAGMRAAISELSAVVEEQRVLLMEVEDVCGRDGHGGPLEDGESELIDKVRRHLGMLAPQQTAPVAQQAGKTPRRKFIDLFATAGEWFRDSAIEPPKWIGQLLSVLSGHVSGVLDDESTMPSDDQILSACEKAGLWPNTAADWVANGAFQRFFKALQESEA